MEGPVHLRCRRPGKGHCRMCRATGSCWRWKTVYWNRTSRITSRLFRYLKYESGKRDGCYSGDVLIMAQLAHHIGNLLQYCRTNSKHIPTLLIRSNLQSMQDLPICFCCCCLCCYCFSFYFALPHFLYLVQ